MSDTALLSSQPHAVAEHQNAVSSAAPSEQSGLLASLAQTWPLLVGCGLLNVGNGLQSTLLGVRAGLEGYPALVTGLLMAGFYLGFMGGASWAPRAVARVGGIRVFAALASLASVAILLHAVFVEPVTWIVVRILTGFCFAGILVVAESWLNQATTNNSRGQLLAAYMFVSYLGVAAGQALMPVAPPTAATLFMVASVVISVAAIPILLTATRKPPDIETRSISFRRLYRVSPLGTVGTFAAGVMNGSVMGMGAVYVQAVGFSIAEISLFMTIVVLSTALMQWPVGRFSDKIDRRMAISSVSLLATLAAVSASLAEGHSPLVFIISMALFGGFGLSTLGLFIAQTNDYLEPTDLVGASSALVMIMALGSVCGPLAAGGLMGWFGPSAYPLWLAAVSAGTLLFALWRMSQRDALPMDAQGPYVAMSQTPSPVVVQAAEDYHADEVSAEAEPDADEMAATPQPGETMPVHSA
ncbi:MAG: MFS transporter [Pseudomonadota bacterium]